MKVKDDVSIQLHVVITANQCTQYVALKGVTYCAFEHQFPKNVLVLRRKTTVQ